MRSAEEFVGAACAAGSAVGVAPTVKRGDPVGQVSHSAAIVVIWRARVEQIAIDIGSDHYQLIDETNEQRLILAGPTAAIAFCTT